MKEYKFIFPDTSDIKVGDVVEINEERHVLTDNEICFNCSLFRECPDDSNKHLCNNLNAAFKDATK